ncbi:MAG: helix-turn-helix transcriptional regulator, partial [candidate division Zixibacteria bacterium]|nr:helix-turn-helix transcriptional regulator [candidate division Zixibacteria bacterium]NIW43271.1 helix-turn-helix transcriptional regulator [Gammaproteobacteria bacterium]NIX54404.1 helix-turn-helix transcriptional regulator [candidate division Zixibacteria bacterium]
ARFVPLESKNHLLLESEPAWQHFLNEMDDFISSEVPELLSTQPTTRSLYVMDELTRREREILNLIAHGFDNNRIADSLCISSKT